MNCWTAYWILAPFVAWFVIFPLVWKQLRPMPETKPDRVDVAFAMCITLIGAIVWPVMLVGWLLGGGIHKALCKRVGL